MADFLKSFVDGEAILAAETNDNNQFILKSISTAINALKTETEQTISNFAGNFVKPGFVLPWPTEARPPVGYLLCDGSSLLRADSSEGAEDGYADLFAVIGTIWGAEDDYHFNLPPFNEGAYLRCTGGKAASLGLFQAGAIPDHRHTITSNRTDKSGNDTGTVWSYSENRRGTGSMNSSYASANNSFYQSVNEVRTDNYAVNWIIKY